MTEKSTHPDNLIREGKTVRAKECRPGDIIKIPGSKSRLPCIVKVKNIKNASGNVQDFIVQIVQSPYGKSVNPGTSATIGGGTLVEVLRQSRHLTWGDRIDAGVDRGFELNLPQISKPRY